MTDTDLDALARRYFELWQSQLGGLASNPELAGSLARLLAAANAQVTAAFGGRNAGTQPAAAGAAAAATTPGDSAADGRQFGERLAALERRIGDLERQIAESRAEAAAVPHTKFSSRTRQPRNPQAATKRR